MTQDPATRLTHALLISILVMQIMNNPRLSMGGEGFPVFLGAFLLAICFGWALWPSWRAPKP